MNNILEYKGYHAKIEFNAETFTVRGKVEGINDFIDFESDNLADIQKEFRAAVDDYLDFCKEVGKQPDKEYKGTFNIRIAPELHRNISVMATRKGISLNAAVEQAIQEYLLDDGQAKQALKTSVDDLTETIKQTKTVYSCGQELDSENIKGIHCPDATFSYTHNTRMVMN